jgi:hypothetical protein
MTMIIEKNQSAAEAEEAPQLRGKVKQYLNLERKKWTEASMSRFSVAANDSDKNNYPTKPTAMYGTNSNVNPNIIYTLNDNTKIKRKIFIPKVSGVNYVGLLIGPKGTYQKRLEQQSGCKILIRGKYVKIPLIFLLTLLT